MAAGQLMVQAMTVTVNEQLFELLEKSLTVQLTVVVPTGKEEPEGGLQLGEPTPEQLSETLGEEYVTGVGPPLGEVVVTLPGQVIDGGVVSLVVSVTLRPNWLWQPRALSCAV